MVLLLNTRSSTFVNLCLHKDDFGISAKWDFSVTLHGKGACDSLGGIVKQIDQIMTPRQLFNWASTAVPSVHFGYCSMEDYETEQHFF